MRGRERVTGKRITLRQIRSPEQFTAKTLWCHRILASPRQCIFFLFFFLNTEKHMIDSLSQEQAKPLEKGKK